MNGIVRIPVGRKGDFTLIDEHVYKAYMKAIGVGLRLHNDRKHLKYVKFCFEGKLEYLHRWIMGNPEGFEIDHINGDGLDNRLCNLRIVDRYQNKWNAVHRFGRVNFKGVDFQEKPRKFRARIQFKGTRISLGLFETAELAAKAYDDMAIRLFKEYACPNFKSGLDKHRTIEERMNQ